MRKFDELLCIFGSCIADAERLPSWLTVTMRLSAAAALSYEKRSMSENIVHLDARYERREPNEASAEYEAFLLQEGLELLALYRSISNQATRRSLLDLIKTAAARQAR